MELIINKDGVSSPLKILLILISTLEVLSKSLPRTLLLLLDLSLTVFLKLLALLLMNNTLSLPLEHSYLSLFPRKWLSLEVVLSDLKWDPCTLVSELKSLLLTTDLESVLSLMLKSAKLSWPPSRSKELNSSSQLELKVDKITKKTELL